MQFNNDVGCLHVLLSCIKELNVDGPVWLERTYKCRDCSRTFKFKFKAKYEPRIIRDRGKWQNK